MSKAEKVINIYEASRLLGAKTLLQDAVLILWKQLIPKDLQKIHSIWTVTGNKIFASVLVNFSIIKDEDPAFEVEIWTDTVNDKSVRKLNIKDSEKDKILLSEYPVATKKDVANQIKKVM